MAYATPEDRIAAREQFVRLVVAGKSQETIATEMNMTTRTCYNWLRRPAIRKRIEQALDRLRDRHTSAILSAAGKGRRALVRLLKSDDDKIKLGAARAIVAEVGRAIELRTSQAAASQGPESAPTESLAEAWAGLQTIFDRQQRGALPTPPPTNGHFAPPHNGRSPP
ncbi:MAG TPA: helix-turn-helix domain-containing protein [Pirellulales bacterium]|nr:helix-turn-helix domain-containing protein [Pirellulales bacterium]